MGGQSRRIGTCWVYVDREDEYVQTDFPDGTSLPCRPLRIRMRGVTEEMVRNQAILAARLSYGEGETAVARMAVDHDIAHTVLSVALGKPYSPVLHAAGRGVDLDPDAGGWEEEVTTALQVWMNRREATGPLRVLRWFGVDPDDLAAQVRSLGRESVPE